MSDEEANTRLNSFDKEPATGHRPDATNQDVTEHADLHHRLEAESNDSTPITTESQAQLVTPPETTSVVSQEVSTTAPQSSPPAMSERLPHAGPGLMVLQWLTYAFWGWTVLSLSGLIVLVVNQLISSNSNDSGSVGYSYWFGGGIAYVLAAVIVLFIISLLCDLFYANAEKKHVRTSGTNVIMIIHAVIFALFGIGALIMSVFGLVSLMIGETADTSGAISGIISGGIIFVLYGLSLLRVLRPVWVKGVVPIYWLAMTVTIVIAIVLGVIGPVAATRLQNKDIVIEEGMPAIATAVSSYTNGNGKLPTSLDQILSSESYGLSEQSKKLIDDDMVRYTPGEKLAMNDFTVLNLGIDQQGGTLKTSYAYTLCVTYNTKDNTSYGGNVSPYVAEGQKYPTTLETYGHKAGEVCYDLQTS